MRPAARSDSNRSARESVAEQVGVVGDRLQLLEGPLPRRQVLLGDRPAEPPPDRAPGEAALRQLLAGAELLGHRDAAIEEPAGPAGAAELGLHQGGLAEGVGGVVPVGAGQAPGATAEAAGLPELAGGAGAGPAAPDSAARRARRAVSSQAGTGATYSWRSPAARTSPSARSSSCTAPSGSPWRSRRSASAVRTSAAVWTSSERSATSASASSAGMRPPVALDQTARPMPRAWGSPSSTPERCTASPISAAVARSPVR